MSRLISFGVGSPAGLMSFLLFGLFSRDPGVILLDSEALSQSTFTTQSCAAPSISGDTFAQSTLSGEVMLP